MNGDGLERRGAQGSPMRNGWEFSEGGGGCDMGILYLASFLSFLIPHILSAL